MLSARRRGRGGSHLHRFASAWTSRSASVAAEGRIIEIFGPESSGKTTLALHVIAEAQKKGGICGFVDAEHALDTGYARKLASIWMNSSSPSPIPASRRWRSPTHSFAPARWT